MSHAPAFFVHVNLAFVPEQQPQQQDATNDNDGSGICAQVMRDMVAGTPLLSIPHAARMTLLHVVAEASLSS